jgi:hypothetical protein
MLHHMLRHKPQYFYHQNFKRSEQMIAFTVDHVQSIRVPYYPFQFQDFWFAF